MGEKARDKQANGTGSTSGKTKARPTVQSQIIKRLSNTYLDAAVLALNPDQLASTRDNSTENTERWAMISEIAFAFGKAIRDGDDDALGLLRSAAAASLKNYKTDRCEAGFDDPDDIAFGYSVVLPGKHQKGSSVALMQADWRKRAARRIKELIEGGVSDKELSFRLVRMLVTATFLHRNKNTWDPTTKTKVAPLWRPCRTRADAEEQMRKQRDAVLHSLTANGQVTVIDSRVSLVGKAEAIDVLRIAFNALGISERGVFDAVNKKPKP